MIKTYKRLSLTLRLTLLFLAAAITAFSLSAVCFDWALRAQLRLRDDSDIVARVEPLRRVLAQASSVDALRASADTYLAIAGSRPGLQLVILDENNDVLLSSAAQAPHGSTLPRVELQRAPNASDVRPVQADGETLARAVKAAARLGASGPRVDLIIASLDTEQTALQAHYHRNLLYIIVLGTALSALLGIAAARAGLRPLRTVVQLASRISAERLNERLPEQDAPAEVAELAAAFNGMLERLDDSFRRLSQFSADLAHDFRTPLNNLMLETQLGLAKVRTTAEYQALLESNLQEYERLSRMIGNMLFLARADQAEVALKKEWFALRAELEKIAEYFDGLAAEAGVTVAVEATGDLYADRLLFERAVSNLVANAIRYTPQGETIWLHGVHRGELAVVDVTNPGAGIDPRDRERLFDRFYRADPARDGRSGSAGLGLAIVKSIMTLHAGSVEVVSAVQGETSFRLTFAMPSDQARRLADDESKRAGVARVTTPNF